LNRTGQRRNSTVGEHEMNTPQRPVDLLRQIDQDARRPSVARQAFIKVRPPDALGKAASMH